MHVVCDLPLEILMIEMMHMYLQLSLQLVRQ